jgi:hypothetical protein
MIDIKSEKLISVEEAATMLPGRKAGGRVHPITVKMWSTRGKRGVKLETILAGSRRCTSVEAMERFFQALDGAPSGQEGLGPPRMRSARARNAAVAAAVDELQRKGA